MRCCVDMACQAEVAHSQGQWLLNSVSQQDGHRLHGEQGHQALAVPDPVTPQVTISRSYPSKLTGVQPGTSFHQPPRKLTSVPSPSGGQLENPAPCPVGGQPWLLNLHPFPQAQSSIPSASWEVIPGFLVHPRPNNQSQLKCFNFTGDQS